MYPDGVGRPRIKALGLSNFRSLEDQSTIHFGDLTGLVGPNGAGKSNIADALQFVADICRLGLSPALELRQGFSAISRWSGGRPRDVNVAVVVGDGKTDGRYMFTLGATSGGGYEVKWEGAEWGPNEYVVDKGKLATAPVGFAPRLDPSSLVLPLVAGDPRFRPLASALRNIAVYSIFPQELREPQKPDPTRPMERHGKNWCSVLQELEDRPEKAEILSALTKLTGDVDGLRVTAYSGYQFAEFRHQSDDGGAKEKWLNAGQESDGTLRVAGILTALLQKSRMTMVGIEEPELTVHPGAVALIADFLKEASRKCQILMTTHSPDLLDCLDPGDVQVVTKERGVTTVRPLEAQQKQTVRDRLMTLGEIARVEGLRPGAD